MPHCCIGVDVIVGFPGETEEDFEETFQYLSDLDISYLHVFTYSERANTIATEMSSSVPMSVRKERNRKLRALSLKKKQHFYQSHIDRTCSVLVEDEVSPGIVQGFTDNYIKVKVANEGDVKNTIQSIKIGPYQSGGTCEATICEPSVFIL